MKQITDMRKLSMFAFAFGAAAVVAAAYSPPAQAGPLLDACGMWINKAKAAPKKSPEFAKWLKQMDTQWVSINEPRNADAEASCTKSMALEPSITHITDNPFGIPAQLSVEFADATGNKTRYRFHF